MTINPCIVLLLRSFYGSHSGPTKKKKVIVIVIIVIVIIVVVIVIIVIIVVVIIVIVITRVHLRILLNALFVISYK